MALPLLNGFFDTFGINDIIWVSVNWRTLTRSRDRSHAPRAGPNMYSRQGIHPQRVTGTPHGTPDPPARPFAPYRRARAPMSDRASRSRVAPCGHDTRRAAHCARGAARALLTHLRWLSHTTHNAHSNLLLMHMHAAVPSVLAHTSARAREALGARCGSLGSRWPFRKSPNS